jgi:hypothetical protein
MSPLPEWAKTALTESRVIGAEDFTDPTIRKAVRWHLSNGSVCDVKHVAASPFGMGNCHANARHYQEQWSDECRVIVGFAQIPRREQLAPHSWVQYIDTGEHVDVTWRSPAKLYFGVAYENYTECAWARTNPRTSLTVVCAWHALGICGCGT